MTTTGKRRRAIAIALVALAILLIATQFWPDEPEPDTEITHSIDNVVDKIDVLTHRIDGIEARMIDLQLHQWDAFEYLGEYIKRPQVIRERWAVASFTVTTYTREGMTDYSTTPQEGRTLRVNTAIIPLGTEVWLDGFMYIAEDAGEQGNSLAVYAEKGSGEWESLAEWRLPDE